jgi:hypothetical protein
VYYKVEQKVALRVWNIIHNLGTIPSLQVHVQLADGTLLETSDYTMTVVNPFELEVTFQDPCVGVAQCFARSSVSDEKRELILTKSVIAPDSYTMLTGGSILSLAVSSNWNQLHALGGLTLWIRSATTNNIIFKRRIMFTSRTSSNSPWWKQLHGNDYYTRAYFSGKSWDIVTARVDGDILDNRTVTDGSPFFFTNTRLCAITNVNQTNRTFTVNEPIDISLLPVLSFAITGSIDNNKTFTIVNAIINVDKSTTFTVRETLLDNSVSGAIVLNYPVGIGSPLIYALLSRPPHSSFDKNLTEVINLGELSPTNTVNVPAYQLKGQLYVKDNLKQTVYPSIVA